jgi:glycosyltransferase involved in cell wall biosynthesis
MGLVMKFSIITAVYKSAETVGQAIASVVGQSHRDIEHLIIEGASGDDTLAAVEAAAHDRMVVTSEPDKGIYDALNKGIMRANGDVVGLVHADDYLAHDDVLADIAAAFRDPRVEAVYGDLDYVSKNETSRVIRHWSSGSYHGDRLAQGWMPPHPTLYLRRSVFDRIGVYDTRYRIAADYDFVLRYFSETRAQPVYLPQVLVKMRVGGESNRSLGRVIRKSREDYAALRQNQVGGIGTLLRKNASKLSQFRMK